MRVPPPTVEYPLDKLTDEEKRWLDYAAHCYKLATNDAGAQLWEDMLADYQGRTVWEGGHIQMEINLLKAAVTRGGYLYDPDFDPRRYRGPLLSIYHALVAEKGKSPAILPIIEGAKHDRRQTSWHSTSILAVLDGVARRASAACNS